MLFAIKSVSNLQKDNAIYRRINYLHATDTSSSGSVSCVFGLVLLLEREPRRQTNDLANETHNNNNNDDDDDDNSNNNNNRLY